MKKYITVIAQDTTSGMACTMKDYATQGAVAHVDSSGQLIAAQ